LRLFVQGCQVHCRNLQVVQFKLANREPCEINDEGLLRYLGAPRSEPFNGMPVCCASSREITVPDAPVSTIMSTGPWPLTLP
jgi:hypothetical protein